jgi:hypothetical protein
MMNPLITKNRSTPASPNGDGRASLNPGSLSRAWWYTTNMAAIALKYWIEDNVPRVSMEAIVATPDPY